MTARSASRSTNPPTTNRRSRNICTPITAKASSTSRWRSDDIYNSVETLQARGVAFQDTPDTYYERLDNRIKGHGEDVAAAEARPHPDGRRADGRQGLLLQIFTQNAIGPIFFEIIQRKGNRGLRRRQFPGAVRIHRSRPDQARSAAGMSAKNWIEFPHIEGEASRQAHADLPNGTYRTRNRPRRLLRSGDASLSSPSADGLDVVRRAAAPARLRCGESRGGERDARTRRRFFFPMRGCRCASGRATAR